MGWFKAKFFLLLIAIVWGSLIIMFLPILIMTKIYDWAVQHKVKWFIGGILVGDFVTNWVLGGDHKTYISSVLGHMKKTGSRGGTVAAAVVDWLFYIGKGEINHCVNAMKPTDVYNFSARRAILGFFVYCFNLFLLFKLLQYIILFVL